MVDDRYLVDRLQQRLALHIVRAVDVHDDQQRVKIAHDHRVFRADEHVFVLRQCLQLFDQLGCHRVVLVDHNMHRLALGARRTDHAGGRADRVHIAVAVTHDEHLRGIADQLGECVGHHAAFDLGPFFDFFTQAAVELEAVTVFDNRLVAAARKRHIDGETGVFGALLQRIAVPANADGQGCQHALVVFDLAHFLQHAEFARSEFVELGVFNDENILVAVILAQHRLAVPRPGGQALVDRSQNIGFFRIGRVFHQLFVVVDRNDRNRRLTGRGLVAQVNVFRAVDKVQHHHLPRVALHHAAVHMIGLLAHAQLARKLGFALDQPARFKGGREFGQPHVTRAGEIPADLDELIVCPDDFPGRGQGDHGRQRGFGHGFAHLTAVDLDIFHQILQHPPAVALSAQRNRPQQHAQRNTDQPIRHGKIQSSRRKQQKDHINHNAARPEPAACFFVFQIPVPLFGRKYTG